MPSIGVVLSHDHGRPRENSCKGGLYIFRARTATFEVIEHARQMIACIYGAGPCARLYSTTVGNFPRSVRRSSCGSFTTRGSRRP